MVNASNTDISPSFSKCIIHLKGIEKKRKKEDLTNHAVQLLTIFEQVEQLQYRNNSFLLQYKNNLPNNLSPRITTVKFMHSKVALTFLSSGVMDFQRGSFSKMSHTLLHRTCEWISSCSSSTWRSFSRLILACLRCSSWNKVENRTLLIYSPSHTQAIEVH